MVAMSMLLASGDACAAGEVLFLMPLALLGLASGSAAGCIAGNVKSSPAIFAVAFAAYSVMSLLAAAMWASDAEGFFFAISYAVLVGVLPFSLAFMLLQSFWRSRRRRQRRLRRR